MVMSRLGYNECVPKKSFLNKNNHNSKLNSMDQKINPTGLAMWDYFNGDHSACFIVEREDGIRAEIPVHNLFRFSDEFSDLEKFALNICKGKVVDLSAGAGPNCLELQKRGFDVVGVDISPHACEIMKKRGVKNVRCLDLFDFNEGDFDTILLFGNSIVNVEDLNGLERFLIHAKNILRSDGQIILDSSDKSKSSDPIDPPYLKKITALGRNMGEFRFKVEYKEIITPFSGYLHVDPFTLNEYCEKTSWTCEIVKQASEGRYLARLLKTKENAENQ
jgi:2-polyprenyl-3-methyl-5-hydroxy-6-metoxy-1,4-benzoquinol methylase